MIQYIYTFLLTTQHPDVLVQRGVIASPPRDVGGRVMPPPKEMELFTPTFERPPSQPPTVHAEVEVN